MKIDRLLLAVLALSFVFFSRFAVASDTAKEKRWADQIVDTLIDGDAVWLETGKTKVLSIYTESATKPAKGVVIVAHGTGVHPDWADVVNPLRVKLTQRGWSTLSLQMPILHNEAKENDYAPLFPEIAPRMSAAVDFLKTKGINNIVLAGHSLGSTMSAYYLAHNAHPVKGFVSVGTSGVSFDVAELRFFTSLPKLNKLPILDIYGSNDTKDVLATVGKRKEIAEKSGNTRYMQVKVEGANHFFQGKDEELVKEVSGWLDRNVSR